MADCEVIDPVVLSPIHVVILHPQTVRGNEKWPRKGTKSHETGTTTGTKTNMDGQDEHDGDKRPLAKA